MPQCVWGRDCAWKWASLAVWYILLGLNQCHISPSRSVSQGKLWAKGWQSLALMDKWANKFFSTNLSTVALASISTVHTQLHLEYIWSTTSLFFSVPHTCMLTCSCSETPAHHCVCACIRLCSVQGRVFFTQCWYSTALYPVCQEQQRDNDILYRRL